MFTNKSVMITGGTGTWGQEITRQLLLTGVTDIVIFSRTRGTQELMKEAFNDSRLRFITDDICDIAALNYACRGINIVFHTAALKYGNICENNPLSAVAINIQGTINVIDACIKNNVEICVNISSDKACNANCFYGKTKAIAEGLITEANNRSIGTDFYSIRCGNILGSSGTAVAKWIKQISGTNSITLTRQDISRFFIPVKDAVKYTFEAMEYGARGEIFALRMPVFCISSMAKAVIQKYGDKSGKTKIHYIDADKNERRVEWIVTPEEGHRTIRTKHFFIIFPQIPIKTVSQFSIIQKVSYCTLKDGYCMDDARLYNLEDVHKILKRAGY
jgi:FlaA1/EpsC-like NDP-sugar epimerase